MGIPFYFKNLIRQHGRNIVLPFSSLGSNCDRLFFDFNCALHQCARVVLDRYAAAGGVGFVPLAQQPDLYAPIIHESIRFLDTMIRTVQPHALVYVGVDGVCPLAKMVQQRKRRYCSVMRHHYVQEAARISNTQAPMDWDSNAITPGTEFMRQLNTALHSYANQSNATLEASNHPLRILISDSDVVGEGEHKIMDYLRAHPHPQSIDSRTLRSHGKDIVYGLDADLIMLSMVSPCSDRIYLLRERPAFDMGPVGGMRIQDTYLILHIANLKRCLVDDYMARSMRLSGATIPSAVIQDQDHRDAHIRDYVLLCTLVGNDFIPPLSYIKIKENGIDILLDSYVETRRELQDTHLVTPSPSVDTDINVEFLTKLMEKLAVKENAMMVDVNRAYYERKCMLPPKDKPIQRALASFDHYPLLHRFPIGKINPEVPGWRTHYYTHLFKHKDIDCSIETICWTYLQGLAWIARYYFTGMPPKNWSYPYHYSPTALDLYNALVICDQIAWNARLHKAFSRLPTFEIQPALQLLYVLPPASFHLIHQAFQHILTDPRLQCTHYYPVRFDLCTYLKYYMWETSPLLPIVDIDHLYNIYTSIASSAATKMLAC